ncbi:hypothetical protein H9P43_009686 [Blastocladiella emersonii ATCC 22665]|nr:hypothetical protein H9P43_009686 [Blastocladiella emersonii ATCC 22665]
MTTHSSPSNTSDGAVPAAATASSTDALYTSATATAAAPAEPASTSTLGRLRSMVTPRCSTRRSTPLGARHGDHGSVSLNTKDARQLAQYRKAEAELLRYLPADVTPRLHRVQIPHEFWSDDSPLAAAAKKPGVLCGKRRKGPEYFEINTLEVQHTRNVEGEVKKPHLVLVHGWAGALGMWLKNYETLSQHYHVHALDLLGWGGSSRPTFSDHFTPSPEAAQAFFVESLEAWRRAQGIDKFTLVGHSMGGFVSASYSLKYPDRLDKTVLLSPIGLQGFTASGGFRGASLGQRLQTELLHRAWNITPQRLLSLAGETRARAVMSRVRSRVANVFGTDSVPPETLVEYLLAGVQRSPGRSGEAAFTALMSPFRGWTLPLDAQLREAIAGGKFPPLVLAYGVADWIDPRYAVHTLAPAVPHGRAHAYLLDGAGHHGYVEAAHEFHQVVLRGELGSSGCAVREAKDDPNKVAVMEAARSPSFMSIA